MQNKEEINCEPSFVEMQLFHIIQNYQVFSKDNNLVFSSLIFMVDYAKFIVISTNNAKGKNTKFPCSPRTSNNFLQELDTLCPSHTDLLAPRVCARGRLRVKAVKLLHGRGTLRLCPSHTDLVTLTRLCHSEASVKLLHGLGPRGHVMPLSHGLASGSMHIHEPLCFISLVYEF